MFDCSIPPHRQVHSNDESAARSSLCFLAVELDLSLAVGMIGLFSIGGPIEKK